MTGPGPTEQSGSQTQEARERQEQQQPVAGEGGGSSWNQPRGDTDVKEEEGREKTERQQGEQHEKSGWNKPREQHIPGDQMGEILRSATGPPETDKTPVEHEIDTSELRKKGLKAPDDLPPHEPTVPPKEGPNIHVPEPAETQTERTLRELEHSAETREKAAAESRESKQVLSAEEQAERKRVDTPTDGVGFRHGRHELEPGELKRWHDQLSPAERKALPNAKISIVGLASRSGSDRANMTISEKRAEAVADALVRDYGVKRENITATGFGEWPAADGGAPDHKDNAEDRVAVISIDQETPAGGKVEDRPKGTLDAARAGTDVGDKAGPPEPPHKVTIGEGLKGAGRDFAIELALDAANAGVASTTLTAWSAAKTVFGAIGDLHDNNVQDAIALGTGFALSILDSDVRNPRNPHLEKGKPYTADGLYNRVHGQPTFRKRIDADVHGRVMNRNFPLQVKAAAAVVAGKLNPVLQRARTPAQRQAVLKTFVRAAQGALTDQYRRRGRGGWGSR